LISAVHVVDPPRDRPDHIVFFGTPEVAVPALRGLCEAGLSVDLVVTGVDKRRSRGTKETPSPVKAAAEDLGIRVVHDLDEVLTHVGTRSGSFLGVVVAYGRLLPPPILDALPLVNLHFSLLPRWRGAAPVERAILSGDTETGVCLMRVRHELDAGEVYASRRLPIREDDTAQDLRSSLNRIGVPMLVEACLTGFGPPTPQAGIPSYARKITPDDLRLLWGDALTVSRQIRVGGAFGFVDGQRLKVHECGVGMSGLGDAGRQRGEAFTVDGRVFVCCGDDVVELLVVQPEGRSRVTAASWWNGLRGVRSVRFET
jgi:methionyl-tRNA formyltransferase